MWDSETCEMIGRPLVFKESVNALATMPITSDAIDTFAVGLENGEINIVVRNKETLEWTIPLSFRAHHDWITRLGFNPCPQTNKYLLASCSKDRFVKIFEISIIE